MQLRGLDSPTTLDSQGKAVGGSVYRPTAQQQQIFLGAASKATGIETSPLWYRAFSKLMPLTVRPLQWS